MLVGGLLIAVPVIGAHHVAMACFGFALLGRVTAQSRARVAGHRARR